MTFRRITDPDEAREYWLAGLLYELESGGEIELAYGWGDVGWERRVRYNAWSFYIRLED